MTYFDILAKFLDMFPHYINKVSFWRPAGNHRIRVESKDFGCVEFTYFGDAHWKLSTPGFDFGE